MSEILPTVYLEAWSYGKPVVGGRAHGLPELVEGNRAGIAVSQEPERIAEALVRLLGDGDLRECLGERGRALGRVRVIGRCGRAWPRVGPVVARIRCSVFCWPATRFWKSAFRWAAA